MMKLSCKSIESKMCPNRESIPKCIASPTTLESSNDFLRQIETLDSSGLATSLIQVLESTRAIPHDSKGMIDTVTHDRILTEFLQRITDLVNRRMETGEFGLNMENKNDSNIHNR